MGVTQFLENWKQAFFLHRRSRCADQEDCLRKRSLPTASGHPGYRTCDGDRSHRGHSKGREFAAWMGVVPREHSTGGKQKLLGISKRGNSYLRRLFMQGAPAVMQQRTKQSSGLSRWCPNSHRAHRNVATVALAN